MVKYYYISVSLFLGNYWRGYTLDAFLSKLAQTALRIMRQSRRLFHKIILKKVSLAQNLDYSDIWK